MTKQFRHYFFPMKPTFSGWGMTTTTTEPPWKNPDPVASDFIYDYNLFKSRINSGAFKFKEKPVDTLDELMWRHYIVYLAFTLAAMNTKSPEKNIAECGVCDGMGVSVAIQAAIRAGYPTSCYLYDAWAPMKAELLTKTEMVAAGNYANLDRMNTERNLSNFNIPKFFNQGYIPDVFEDTKTVNPENVVLLMIDLNSSKATTSSLDNLYRKVVPGGIILFDDYLWSQDTKIPVDKFFSNKNGGMMFSLPTGQGMFLKKFYGEI